MVNILSGRKRTIASKVIPKTFQLISVSSEKADTEWKFARSKLWISYFKVLHADDNDVDDGDSGG